MPSGLTARQLKVKLFLEERAERGEPPPTYREICKRFGYKSPKAAVDQVAALEKKGIVKRERGSSRGIRLVHNAAGVPMLGHIAAGLPTKAFLVTDERLNLDPAICGIRDRSRAFALRVTGDSMVGRQIFEGDIVLLEHSAMPQNGDIVAALIDNQCTLKTLVYKEGEAWLQAENPKYPDLVPLLDLQVQGIVRAVIRLMKQ